MGAQFKWEGVIEGIKVDPPNEDVDSNTLFHYSSDSCAVSRLHFSEKS